MKGNQMCPSFNHHLSHKSQRLLPANADKSPSRALFRAWEAVDKSSLRAESGLRLEGGRCRLPGNPGPAGAKVRPVLQPGTRSHLGKGLAPGGPALLLPPGGNRRVPDVSPAPWAPRRAPCGGGTTALASRLPTFLRVTFTAPLPPESQAHHPHRLSVSSMPPGHVGTHMHMLMHVSTHSTVHTCMHTTPTHTVCMYMPWVPAHTHGCVHRHTACMQVRVHTGSTQRCSCRSSGALGLGVT